MQFSDVLTSPGPDGFGRITGFTVFPYFQSTIEVVCAPEVTPEYAARSLQWLSAVDETLVREICQYALYYLQDILESTSIGELLDEDIQHIRDPLEILRYMEFGALTIDMPLDPEVPVLNLSGGCDWQEDNGLQCLIKSGHVIYLGGWDDLDIWRSACLREEDYICNYVFYPRREELRQKAAEPLARKGFPKPIPHLEIPLSSPVRRFIEGPLARWEDCTSEEAWARIENTLLFEFLQEYPQLVQETDSFKYRCFCLERDQGPGDMAQYIEETCKWDLF